MAAEPEVAPAKRGPGRPRKPAQDPPPPESPKKTLVATPDPDDPRIGQKCDPGWSSVGYDDGATYRCEDGVIVERVS